MKGHLLTFSGKNRSEKQAVISTFSHILCKCVYCNNKYVQDEKVPRTQIAKKTMRETNAQRNVPLNNTYV